MNRILFSIVLGVLLSGCLTVQENEVTVNAGRISVILNTTEDNETISNITFPRLPSLQSIVGNDSSVCVWGTPDSRLSQDFFGSIAFYDASVRLHVQWFGEDAPDAFLDSCAVFVLKDDGQGQFMSRAMRQRIHSRLQRGAGMLAMELSSSRDPLDASIIGWQPGFGDAIPVEPTHPGVDGRIIGAVKVSGEFLPVETDPALEGVTQFPLYNLRVTQVNVFDGRVIAYARVGSLPTKPTYPLIIRSQPVANKVYYYAFDALSAPVLLNQTVRSLAVNYFTLMPLRIGAPA